MDILYYRNGVPVTAEDCKDVVDIGRTKAMQQHHERRRAELARNGGGSIQVSSGHYHGDAHKLRKHCRIKF